MPCVVSLVVARELGFVKGSDSVTGSMGVFLHCTAERLGVMQSRKCIKRDVLLKVVLVVGAGEMCRKILSRKSFTNDFALLN